MTRLHNGSVIRDRIVRAATALFSRQGYYKTATREIARLADISEVTLFRYFDHKEDIFTAALQVSYQSIESRLTLFKGGVYGRPPEDILPKIVRLLVDITTFSPELLKLVAVAVLELRGEYHDLCCRMLAPLLSSITGYLAVNIKNGTIRDLNPSIVTAAMALTIIVQSELSNFIDGCTLSRMNDRETLEEFSLFWTKLLIVAVPQRNPKPALILEPAGHPE